MCCVCVCMHVRVHAHTLASVHSVCVMHASMHVCARTRFSEAMLCANLKENSPSTPHSGPQTHEKHTYSNNHSRTPKATICTHIHENMLGSGKLIKNTPKSTAHTQKKHAQEVRWGPNPQGTGLRVPNQLLRGSTRCCKPSHRRRPSRALRDTRERLQCLLS